MQRTNIDAQKTKFDVVQKTKTKSQVVKEVEKTSRVTKLTSILKKPDHVDNKPTTRNINLELKQKNSVPHVKLADFHYSVQFSPVSSKKPIQVDKDRYSTIKSSSTPLPRTFPNGTKNTQESISNKLVGRDKLLSIIYPGSPGLDGSSTSKVGSKIEKLNKEEPATVGKRFQPIINFAGSLFTTDASPEEEDVIDTVMVNDTEEERNGTVQIEEPRKNDKMDMFWCGICGNKFEREEILMKHVETHMLPPIATGRRNEKYEQYVGNMLK